VVKVWGRRTRPSALCLASVGQSQVLQTRDPKRRDLFYLVIFVDIGIGKKRKIPAVSCRSLRQDASACKQEQKTYVVWADTAFVFDKDEVSDSHGTELKVG